MFFGAGIFSQGMPREIPLFNRDWSGRLAAFFLVCYALLPGCASDPELSEQNLLRTLPAARIVEETTWVDLGEGWARPFLKRGWAGDETVPLSAAFAGDQTFVWTVNGPADILFFVADVRPLDLELAIRAFEYPGASEGEVAVEVNGQLAGKISLEGDRLWRLLLWPELLKIGENHLRIVPSRSVLVSDVIPGSKDPRRLGVALFHVRFGEPDGNGFPRFSDLVGKVTSRIPLFPHWVPGIDEGAPGRSEPPQGELELAAPASASWELPLLLGGSLEYEFSLESPTDALVQLEWRLSGGKIEPVAEFALGHGWFSHLSASGRLDLPRGRGELILRVRSGEARVPRPKVRIRRLVVHTVPPAEAPDILFITLDTFRADHLGAYGHPAIRTPNMDRLFRLGTLYSDIHSQTPITGPSHSAIFTGRYPLTTGVRNNAQPLVAREETLAEILRACGWRTAAVVSLAVLHSSLGFAQGFDLYDDWFRDPWWRIASAVTRGAMERLHAFPDDSPFFLWVHYSDPHEPYTSPGSVGAPVELILNDKVVATYNPRSGRYLEIQVDVPSGASRLVFRSVVSGSKEAKSVQIRKLALASPETGISYGAGFSGPGRNGCYRFTGRGVVDILNKGHAKSGLVLGFWALESIDRARALEAYAQEVEFVDSELGLLLEAVEKKSPRRETLVVVTNDHGEGLWNHGFPGHVEQLYQESVHSPFLLYLPGRLEAAVENLPGQHVDERPTLLSLLGLPERGDVQGRVLPLHFVGGPNAALSWAGGNKEIFLQSFMPESTQERRALLREGWKLIWSQGWDRLELYNVPKDPGEERNVANDWPRRVAELKLRLEQLEEEAKGRLLGTDVDEAELEKLRALGYVR